MAAVILCSCSAEKQDESWKNGNYDLSVPQLGQDGWYMVLRMTLKETASTKE